MKREQTNVYLQALLQKNKFSSLILSLKHHKSPYLPIRDESDKGRQEVLCLEFL